MAAILLEKVLTGWRGKKEYIERRSKIRIDLLEEGSIRCYVINGIDTNRWFYSCQKHVAKQKQKSWWEKNKIVIRLQKYRQHLEWEIQRGKRQCEISNHFGEIYWTTLHRESRRNYRNISCINERHQNDPHYI